MPQMTDMNLKVCLKIIAGREEIYDDVVHI